MGTHAVVIAFDRENLHVVPRACQPSRVLAVLCALELWLDRRAQRRALRSLGVEALKDVGLTQADAEREAGKAFWRA